MTHLPSAGTGGVLFFGEIAWDRLWVLDTLPQDEVNCQLLLEQAGPGGCALNSAMMLAAFGIPVTLAGNAIGDDVEGREIVARLRRHGVEARIVLRPELRTPFCQVLVEEKTGRRGFVLRHGGIREFRPDQLGTLVDDVRAGRFPLVFVQPYVGPGALELMRAIQGSPDVWIMVQDIEPDSPFLPCTDAVQISLSDGDPFTTERLSAVAAPYFRGRCSTVFVTAGPRGVGFCHRDERPIAYPGLRAAAVVDTTGCGDAFRAGVLHALHRGRTMDQAVRVGQKFGARKASVYGSFFAEPFDLGEDA